MKQIQIITVAVVAILAGAMCGSQQPTGERTTKEILQERKEICKMTKTQIDEKATKEARKEAKKLTKEGWQVTPNGLPLEKQLNHSWQIRYEYDENQLPKYLLGEAMSIGETYESAKAQALELAKQNLAGQIQTEIIALIETTLANNQLGAGEAASMSESVNSSKNLISQNIGRIIPVVEVQRDVRNKNKEVLVRIAYSAEMAKNDAKRAIRQDLENKGEDLHKQLDKVLKF